MRIQRLLSFSIVLTSIFLSACGLSSKQKEAADNAIKALRKVEASTQVGVNYMQYMQLVIEAKSEVNAANAALPDGELKQELNSAMDAYADAREGWGADIQSGGVGANSDLGKKLIGKYKVQPAYFLDKGDMLHKIWDTAKTHLDRAAGLL
jgi:predicted small secreted protein